MTIVQMSVASGILIGAVMAVRALSAGRLPGGMLLFLWWLALARLLLPFSFASPFSVYSLTGGTAGDGVVRVLPVFSYAEGGTAGSGISQTSVWAVVWVAGMAVCGLYVAAACFWHGRRFAGAVSAENAFAEKWLSEHRLRRRIRIRQSGRIEAPLTYGIFRPVILLPKNTDWTADEELGYVLEHEYVHIRRFDAVTKAVLAAALCIHWFNPMVWMMYVLANRDVELSCDEAVLRNFGEEAKAGYAMALIRMEEKKSGLAAVYSGFGAKAAEERIRRIMRYKKHTAGNILAACLLVGLVTVLFATSSEAVRAEGKGMAPRERKEVEEAPMAGEEFFTVEEVKLYSYHEDGGLPYLHDVFTNGTGREITGLDYYMLAYDEAGRPLRLKWRPIDSSSEVTYACLVERETDILPGETYDVPGGWSLYDSDAMPEFEGMEEEGSRQVAYALFGIKRITFADGGVWDNPDTGKWLETYEGKEVDIRTLQSYYPYTCAAVR